MDTADVPKRQNKAPPSLPYSGWASLKSLWMSLSVDFGRAVEELRRTNATPDDRGSSFRPECTLTRKHTRRPNRCSMLQSPLRVRRFEHRGASHVIPEAKRFVGIERATGLIRETTLQSFQQKRSLRISSRGIGRTERSTLWIEGTCFINLGCLPVNKIRVDIEYSFRKLSTLQVFFLLLVILRATLQVLGVGRAHHFKARLRNIVTNVSAKHSVGAIQTTMHH